MPKLLEVVGWTKTKIYWRATVHVRLTSLQCQWPSKWVWLMLEIKQNYWSILSRVVLLPI